MIQSAYASFVEVKPAGAGLSKPGKASTTTSLRVSCARTRSQTRYVLGTPCTSTTGVFSVIVFSSVGVDNVVYGSDGVAAIQLIRRPYKALCAISVSMGECLGLSSISE